MTEKRMVGQILRSHGRITEADVAHALEYQAAHGGYFGEALVACGIVSQGELEWGLASQFDLPYVFPEADSIDPEAVALVSPEWALAHLTLPLLKTDDVLTVVVESPMRTTAVDELEARTGLRVELALGSGARIRELIRQVYARATAADTDARHAPITLTDAFDEALRAASSRFGISTRGKRSWAWWDDAGTIRRRPLEGDWEPELIRVLSPAPTTRVDGRSRAKWDALVTRGGMATAVEVMFLSDESGHEYLFRPKQEQGILRDRFPPPSAGVLSELRLLARSGSARFVVTANPEELGHEVLPHLPALLLDPSWRSVYINAREQSAADEAFSVRMPQDRDQWITELETLRSFHFDVVTVDLAGSVGDWASSALDVASIAFLLWVSRDDTKAAYEAGIRWALHVDRRQDGGLDWSLEPLHG